MYEWFAYNKSLLINNITYITIGTVLRNKMSEREEVVECRQMSTQWLCFEREVMYFTGK